MSALGVVMPAHFFRSYMIEKCHCTLIYLGEHDKAIDVMHKKDKVEAAVYRLNMQSSILSVKVKGMELFADGHVTVLTLEQDVLNSYRRFLDRELARDGIRSASNWAYRPHVTINKHEKREKPLLPDFMNAIPDRVYLDMPSLWWASPNGDH